MDRRVVAGDYDVSYSNNKNADTATVTVTASDSYYSRYTGTIKKMLKIKPQKVYVRARAYHYTNSGTLKVGPWSTVKSVTPY